MGKKNEKTKKEKRKKGEKGGEKEGKKGKNEVKMGKIYKNMGKKQVFLIFFPQTPSNFHIFSP